jgi:hypothetical protein
MERGKKVEKESAGHRKEELHPGVALPAARTRSYMPEGNIEK